MKILIFTDGASSGNPGKGGFGVVMKLENTEYYKEFSQGYRLTTNNRMELLAVIFALKQLKKKHQQVIVFSDSKYVIDCFQKKWFIKWQREQFSKVKNPDLWKELLQLVSQHSVEFCWIKGHAGHPENERADFLAVNASQENNLLTDVFYEKSIDANH